MKEYRFQVTEELEGLRIDKALTLLLDSLSRSYIAKLIKVKIATQINISAVIFFIFSKLIFIK